MIVVLVLAVLLSVGSGPTPVGAQQCDDDNSCTSNDMCSSGICSGTAANGGACDDGNPCTVNDNCLAGTCMGTPAGDGTSCGDGCGMCTFGFCLPDFAKNGQGCNDDISCTTSDVCQFGFCFGTFKQCPDSDGNPCTVDFCNPQNGQCQAFDFPPCPSCQTCRASGSNFQCDPAPNGTACDDMNVCTASSMCVSGECQEGIPSGQTPTPTAVVGQPTATATLPVPTPTSSVPTPTPGGSPCIGDCGGDGQVSVDEIIRAVNIALGNLTTNDCPAADGNGDGQVTVDEIVAAVNNALNGCP